MTRTLGDVLVVSRFRSGSAHDPSIDERLRADLEAARAALAARPGYLGGRIGRNVDEADLWVLVTEWADVGSYRRALSSYDVKLAAVPVLSRAIEEPSAYESAEPGTELNRSDVRSIK